MNYHEDRLWSDQFIPEIRQLVGPHLLMPSPFEVDTKQAADLIVLRARDMTIACRIRRQGYVEKYRYDFTIRSERDSGADTELRKIVDGWGDWMFYGHDDGENPGRIRPWYLIDLHVWRAEMIRNRRRYKLRQIPNGDGTHFVPFDVRKFPPELLIAASSLAFEPSTLRPQSDFEEAWF